MKKILFLPIVAFLLCSADELDMKFYKRPKPKLIEFSWASPDTGFLRRHIREMEESTPYDGISIDLRAMGEYNGKEIKCSYPSICTSTPWQYEWFREARENLKNTHFQKFTDNFLRTTLNAPDWFNEPFWKSTMHNFAIVARIAKETGMKGISVDTEMYSGSLFTLKPHPKYAPEEIKRQARRRGREFAKTVFGEFPDAKIFLFYGWREAAGNFPDQFPLENKYLLFLPFLNGLYDELPSTGTIIDGSESFGYLCKNHYDFAEVRRKHKTELQEAVDVRNIGKYRSQTQFSPAIYLDAFFTNRKPTVWQDRISPDGNHRLRLFLNALIAAFNNTDEYVWTWGERCSWWDAEEFEINKRWKPTGTWEKNFPGITRVTEFARNPVGYPDGIFSDKDALPLQNADFSASPTKQNKPLGWDFWQWPFSKGHYQLAPGKGKNGKNAVLLQNVASGCIYKTMKLTPGKTYLIYGRGKIENDKHVVTLLSVRWRNEKTWNNYGRDRTTLFRMEQKSTWISAGLVVNVPMDSPYTAAMFSVKEQSKGGKVYFDLLQVFPLD